ncbi:MAG: T3SS effector HopA1 family protein [Egibacteraceae bacterium]
MSAAAFPELAEHWVSGDLRRARVAGRTLAEKEPRDLEARIGLALYEVLHLRRAEELPVQARMVRDRLFEDRLTAAVPHGEVTVPTTLSRRDQARGLALVEWAGVNVWVPLDRLVGGEGAATDVRVRPEHPAVSPGFLMVQGSRPSPSQGPLLRAYVHIADADGAGAVWGVVLRALEASRAPYRAKISSVRWFYPRTDALTVYLPRGSWHAARSIAEAVDGMAEVSPPVSAFCRRLADGVAVAWEPTDRRPGRQRLSFGEHRSSVVASALIQSVRAGLPWDDVLRDVWRAASVDPTASWRNDDSPDLDLDQEAALRESGAVVHDRPAVSSGGPRRRGGRNGRE